MNPLKIEVTEAMREAATAAIYTHDLLHGIVDKTWANASAAIKAHYGEMATAALTAAFQHPEFVRQIREQVVACVPEDAKKIGDDEFVIEMGAVAAHCTTACGIGYNTANNRTRANLAGLLGDGDG
jgi:hypothetical protein